MPPEDQSAGATPAAGGATPPQTPPAQPAAAPADPTDATASSATDDAAAALGDPGKRALEALRTELKAERDARKAEKQELEDLKSKSLTDTERAIADAKKAGAAEVTDRFHAQVRRSEVKAALSGAGINAGVLDLAVKADEFLALKVTDDGDVEGLDEAVKAFKNTHKELFSKPASDGSADGGARDRSSGPAKDLDTAIGAHYSR